MRAVTGTIAAVALALTAASCGGSARTGVAQLGTTTSASTSPAAQAGGAAAFSDCMRAHGIAAYPDPSSNGLPPKKSPQELGVSESAFVAAQRACVHLLPNGGLPTASQVAQYRSAMLVYAHCIRVHGVPAMPDPDSRGHLDIGPGTAVDVNSPAFKAAFAACKKDILP